MTTKKPERCLSSWIKRYDPALPQGNSLQTTNLDCFSPLQEAFWEKYLGERSTNTSSK